MINYMSSDIIILIKDKRGVVNNERFKIWC
nr:MAG TPA: hypothetical protein [Caudoviricetes sp.]